MKTVTRFVHSSPKRHNAVLAAARDLMSSNSTKGFEIMAQAFRATAEQHARRDMTDALSDAGIPFQIAKGGDFILYMRHSGKGQVAFR